MMAAEGGLLIVIAFFAIAIAIIIGIAIPKPDPEERGQQGERTISNILMEFDPIGKDGHIIRNLYVPSGHGNTREIDLLCVTAKGLIVIESKNYAGYIFGDENQQNWTVTLYAGYGNVEKHKFFNPIWQNNSHINALKRYLGYDIPMFSIVAFSNRGEIKSVNYKESHATVCYMLELPSVLDRLWKDNPDIFSKERVDATANKLSKLVDTDGSKKQAHLERLEERYSNTEICPWCGGKLKVRTARQGKNAGKQFYGCVNYPRCKYTKNM